MKRKLWSIISIILLSTMIVSCSKDEDPYVIFEFRLDCPSALLRYATPQVTYKGNDGGAITFTIPESEWTETGISNGMTTVVINGETVVLEAQRMMRWTKRVRYDEIPAEDEMTVVYIPKNNVPAGNVSVIDNFEPKISGEMNYWDELGKMHQFTGDGINPNVAFGSGTSLADIISKYQNYMRLFLQKAQ
ncbi:MAG: hypothetical protein J1E57_07285 [Prevotella sp.]|nr:hypothetical protein [Prevotella sp.]